MLHWCEMKFLRSIAMAQVLCNIFVEIHFSSSLTKSPHKPSHDHVVTEVMQAVRLANLSDKDATSHGHASVLLSVSQCAACSFSRASTSRGAPWAAELWQGAGGDGKAGCLGHEQWLHSSISLWATELSRLCFLLSPLPPASSSLLLPFTTAE